MSGGQFEFWMNMQENEVHILEDLRSADRITISRNERQDMQLVDGRLKTRS